MMDPRFRAKESIQDLRLTSILCMPIKLDGKIASLVHLESNRPGHFTEQHEVLLRSLLDVAAPDEILVTEAVADHVEHDRLIDRGLVELKGVGQPRHVLAVKWS